MRSNPVSSSMCWINAFIKKRISGYTITVPSGTHRGKTMIPGPGAMNLRSIIKCVPTSTIEFMRGISGMRSRCHNSRVGRDAVGLSDCYLTDQVGSRRRC